MVQPCYGRRVVEVARLLETGVPFVALYQDHARGAGYERSEHLEGVI